MVSSSKYYVSGAKTSKSASNIIKSFDPSAPMDLTTIVDKPASKDKPEEHEDPAEALLKAARERFQTTSPPPKRISVQDGSPIQITDSPLQASLQKLSVAHNRCADFSEQACSG